MSKEEQEQRRIYKKILEYENEAVSLFLSNPLAECLFQEQEFKMWSIGYVEIYLSICVSAFWDFWFYNILAESLFHEQEFQISYYIGCA